MPEVEISPPTRTRDMRAVVAGCAALFAAVLSVGQLLAAQSLGVLSRGGVVDDSMGRIGEATLVVWLTATSVSLAAAIPSLWAGAGQSRRSKLTLCSAAAFGGLLSVPVAAAVAAWIQMHGGDSSQPQMAGMVTLGVLAGAAAAWAALSWRAAMWSLGCWAGLVWVLTLTSAAAAPETTPTIGLFDPGPAWSDDSRVLQARLVLGTAATLVGAGLGVWAAVSGWGRSFAGRSEPAALAVVLSVGPLLMLASYGLAAATSGQVGWTDAVTLGLGLFAAVAAAAAVTTAAQRISPHPGA